jgi:hypothetical protein
MFFLQQNQKRGKRVEQVLPGSVGEGWGCGGVRRGGGVWEGEVAQTMYTHVSKCKNDKIKGEKIKKKRMGINH